MVTDFKTLRGGSTGNENLLCYSSSFSVRRVGSLRTSLSNRFPLLERVESNCLVTFPIIRVTLNGQMYPSLPPIV